MGSLFDAQKMLISSFCMRDASVLPEKLLFDNIDGTCTTKEICILPSVLPDKLCYKYNILCLVTLMQHTKNMTKIYFEMQVNENQIAH